MKHYPCLRGNLVFSEDQGSCEAREANGPLAEDRVAPRHTDAEVAHSGYSIEGRKAEVGCKNPA